MKNTRCNPIDARYGSEDFCNAAARIIIDYLTYPAAERNSYSTISEKIYLTWILRFLRDYDNGRMSTIPHAIEMARHRIWDISRMIRTFYGPAESYPKMLTDEYPKEAAIGISSGLAMKLTTLCDDSTYWTLTGDDFLKPDKEGRPMPRIPSLIDTDSIKKRRIVELLMQIYGPSAGEWEMIMVRLYKPMTREEEKKFKKKAKDNRLKIEKDIETLINTFKI